MARAGKTTAILLGAIVAMTACKRDGAGAEVAGSKSGTAEVAAAKRIRVVATTGMIADAVQRVGGEWVEVAGLMGPGVDPHLYKASAGDVRRMSSADIVFYNGLHLEGAMAELFEKMKGRVTTVAVAEQLDKARLLTPDDAAGIHDPHVWFDVELWAGILPAIADALARATPSHADAFQGAAAAYGAELTRLHEEVRRSAGEIPADRRALVTSHDAFFYFGRAYGFEVRGLQGISTAAEAGAADVKALADFIAKRKIPAVFVESSVSPRNLEAVREAVQARGHSVKIGGELFSDAMGSPETPEGTYIGMIRHNINVVSKALGE